MILPNGSVQHKPVKQPSMLQWQWAPKPYEFRGQGNIISMSETTKQLLTLQGAFVDGWNPEQVWTLNPHYGWQYMTMPRVTADAAGECVCRVFQFLGAHCTKRDLLFQEWSSHQ